MNYFETYHWESTITPEVAESILQSSEKSRAERAIKRAERTERRRELYSRRHKTLAKFGRDSVHDNAPQHVLYVAGEISSDHDIEPIYETRRRGLKRLGAAGAVLVVAGGLTAFVASRADSAPSEFDVCVDGIVADQPIPEIRADAQVCIEATGLEVPSNHLTDTVERVLDRQP